MCGILAHLSTAGRHDFSAHLAQRLNDTMIHRGPDDSGVAVLDPAVLAMRRLSILDLQGGHQPMSYAQGRYTIVFNGEIYNHRQVRRELEQTGVHFQTHSDTEVILAAYALWGSQSLAKLNGMFAFCIWDAHAQELFAARDRMGIKPLYVAHNSDHVMFASELTPIEQSGLFDLSLDLSSICNYISYWYVCEPQTVYAQVKQLPPGSFARVSRRGIVQERYWHIPNQKEGDMPFDQARDQLDTLINEAVQMQMEADVPVGTFLSGGIDSGIVTAVARRHTQGPLESFAIGFKERSYDETALAQATARRHQVDLNIYTMTDVTPSLIETITGCFDEPLGNASYVPSYLLAQAARQKMKVVLTGDGGDELFGGYPTYQAPFIQAKWRALPDFIKTAVRNAVQLMPVSHGRISLDYRLKQLMQGVDLDYRRAHFTWREFASLSSQQKLWKTDQWAKLGGHDPFAVCDRYFQQARDLSVINQLMYVDLNTYLLNDHLRKVDRMTMAHSLEARVPLLDHRIVELAMGLPDAFKVTSRQTKVILKSVAQKYLPSQVIQSKKKGLTSPIAHWLCVELKDYLADTLKGGLVDQLFNRDYVDQLCREHWQKKFDHSRLLWSLLTLQIWYKKRKGVL